MRSKILFLLLITSFSFAMIGCSGGPTPANNGNTAANTGNTNDVLATKTPAPDATTNGAPTLTPVFKAYCDAMVKKDEAALRKVYSSDTIKYFEGEMKRDKVATLVKYLEADDVSGKICEVRNEQITGDMATAEIRADSYPNGIKVIFVKENGEWKLTNRNPTLDAAKNAPAANNSTAANKAPAAPEKNDAKKK